MSISNIYILDKKGNVLINRNYKNNTDFETVENFQKSFASLNETNNSPFILDNENNCVYTYLRHSNIICIVISFDFFTPGLQWITNYRISSRTDFCNGGLF